MTDIEKMLAKANNVEDKVYPPEVNKRLVSNHPCGDENALLRKEIARLAQAVNVPLSAEFEAYYNEAEGIKASVKEELGI